MGINLQGVSRQNKIELDSHEALSKYQKNFLKEVVESNSWHLDFRNYIEKQWKSLLRHITSCTTIRLSITPIILAQITHIRFQSLKELKLNNLYLASIEPIVHLYAPLLQELELTSNGCYNLKSLRKMFAPSLKRIQIVEQAVTDVNYFSELNLSKQMTSITIFNTSNKIIPENYSWIFKLQPTRLDYFEYYNTQIIGNRSYGRMLKNKYPNVGLKLRYDNIDGF